MLEWLALLDGLCVKSFLFFKAVPVMVIAVGVSFYGIYLTCGRLPSLHSIAQVTHWNSAKAIVVNGKNALVNTATRWLSDDVGDANVAVIASADPAADAIIFRWHAADGSVSYGDTPPAHITRVELLRKGDLTPITILSHQAFQQPRQTTTTKNHNPSNKSAPDAANRAMEQPSLIERARAVKRQLEARNQAQQLRLDSLGTQ